MSLRNLLVALAVSAVAASTAAAAQINEFRPNPLGQDPSEVSVELLGTPGSSFSGWLLSIESDASSPFGTIDRAAQVSGSFDSNGLLVVEVPDLENPSFTYVLTDEFTGSTGDSIDSDSNGTPDNLGILGTVLDAIGIPDTDGEVLYGAALGGLDFAYTGDEPGLAFRDGVTGAWYAVNDEGNTPESVFDINAVQIDNSLFSADPELTTFGSVNPTTIPEPASLLLLVVGLLGLTGSRRR